MHVSVLNPLRNKKTRLQANRQIKPKKKLLFTYKQYDRDLSKLKRSVQVLQAYGHIKPTMSRQRRYIASTQDRRTTPSGLKPLAETSFQHVDTQQHQRPPRRKRNQLTNSQPTFPRRFGS